MKREVGNELEEKGRMRERKTDSRNGYSTLQAHLQPCLAILFGIPY